MQNQSKPIKKTNRKQSSQRFFYGCCQFFQTNVYVGRQVDAQGAALAICQHLEIATRLCGLDYAEGIFLSRNGQVHSVVAGNLQEHSAVWAAFVSLSRRVQEPRTKTQTCGYAALIA